MHATIFQQAKFLWQKASQYYRYFWLKLTSTYYIISLPLIFQLQTLFAGVTKTLVLPGLEPGTFRVWSERDNHYTTELITIRWRMHTSIFRRAKFLREKSPQYNWYFEIPFKSSYYILSISLLSFRKTSFVCFTKPLVIPGLEPGTFRV